jgi:muconolactone D-isomerase
MEFLVTIRLDWAALVARADFDDLITAERRVGLQLLDEGVLRRIWRVPGQRANIGIWDAPDATALVRYLDRLPLRAWLDAEVIPLATHDLERLSADASSDGEPARARTRKHRPIPGDGATTSLQERR